MLEFRCNTCGKLIMKYMGTNFTIESKCTRCGTLNTWNFSYKVYNFPTKTIESQDLTLGTDDGRKQTQ